jgi:hypothetical protein
MILVLADEFFCRYNFSVAGDKRGKAGKLAGP